jgi:hypothetical protein
LKKIWASRDTENKGAVDRESLREILGSQLIRRLNLKFTDNLQQAWPLARSTIRVPRAPAALPLAAVLLRRGRTSVNLPGSKRPRCSRNQKLHCALRRATTSATTLGGKR